MKKILLLLLILDTMYGCSQNYGPGYQFSLFKNTVNWKLAQAIERENENEIRIILEKDPNVLVDLRDSVYGQTLLNLAVGNDKIVSTKLLLTHIANSAIANELGFTPIHTAALLIGSRKYSAKILEILLANGADANAIAVINKSNPSKYVPLMDAVKNLECAKLLIEYGADLYYRDSLNYPVWTSMLVNDTKNSESIFFAKYLIVDKKKTIPDPVFYTIPNNIPRSARFLVQKFDTHGDIKKQQAKDEIMNVIKK